MQVYGLTETYGHIMHCAWNTSWDALGFSERAEIKARQGFSLPTLRRSKSLILRVEIRCPGMVVLKVKS